MCVKYFTNIWDEIVTWCHDGVEPEPDFTDIHYGLLYNWYVANNPLIAPIGWHPPSDDEFKSLEIAIGMDPATADLYNYRGTTEGGELKEIGLIYWITPNTGATNEWNFDMRGAGSRQTALINFISLNELGTLWSSSSGTGGFINHGIMRQFGYNTSQINRTRTLKYYGFSIRCIKDDAVDPGAVTDYDGNIYPTIKIGNQVWMAQNLIVKHYNDGTPIPEEQNNVAWAALITGAWCYYNNDSANM